MLQFGTSANSSTAFGTINTTITAIYMSTHTNSSTVFGASSNSRTVFGTTNTTITNASSLSEVLPPPPLPHTHIKGKEADSLDEGSADVFSPLVELEPCAQHSGGALVLASFVMFYS